MIAKLFENTRNKETVSTRD